MRMGRILGLMNTCARRFERRPWLGIAAGFVGYLVCAGTTWSQLPPPPPAPPDHRRPPHLDNTAVVEHLQKVRRHLEEVRAEGPDAEVLLRMARLALDGADQKRIAKDFFGADRRIEAADAFLRATGHPGHVAEGPKGPAPQAREVADHLQRVYFRLQQAEYFASASGEPDAKALPSLARKFYEEARKAYDSGDWSPADEYVKSADDTIHGLENLAQAARPEPPRPPKPL